MNFNTCLKKTFDQVFVCQVSDHCIDKQHNIFDECYKHKESESFLSQSEHTIWFSRHRTLRTQDLHLVVVLWKHYKVLASYKNFCKWQSFCLCTPLLTLTQSSFSSTYLLKFSSSKTFVAWWSVSVVIPFAFLGEGFGDILPTFLFYVKFEQGIQRYQNILNSTFETIYQVRG